MIIDECDRCGRALPSGGHLLFGAVPLTPDVQLGRYGTNCARRVAMARAERLQPVYDAKGRRLGPAGTIVG